MFFLFFYTFAKKFTMKAINKILNCLIIAAIVFIGLRTTDYGQQTLPKYILDISLNDVNKYYENADSISSDDINLYNVFRGGDLIGKIVNTSPFSDEIYGYNSITPLNIYLDSDDKIIEVELCENKESRGFINKIVGSGYLESWDGLTPEEAAKHHVDAVSGCTFSSVAIAQSLQTRMSQLSRQKSGSSLDWKLLLRQICVLIVTVLALICYFMPKTQLVKDAESQRHRVVKLFNFKTLRTITLLLSVAILGFWTNSLLSLALFCNWLSNGVSLSLQLPLLIVAVLAIALPWFTKKSFYCQYLCPFGAAQEFAGKIRQRSIDNRQQSLGFKAKDKRLKAKDESNIKAKVYKFFGVFRKVVLLALLVIFALGVGLDLSVVEPFPVFNYQSIGFGAAIFAAVILVSSIFIKKPWCNYLCPTGTLLRISGGQEFRNSR